LIVSPVEDKITVRLEAEETRREKARNEKEEAENQRKENIQQWIQEIKHKLQSVINKTKTFDLIEDNKKEYLALVEETREFVKNNMKLDEFEVVFDTMLTTQAEAFQATITSLTNAYNFQQANDALEVQKLTNERMNELFDYDFRYKGEVELGKLDEEEYAEILIPERTKFRISEIEKLGFTESAAYKGHYAYIPEGTALILISIREDEYQLAGNEDWSKIFEKAKLEIEEYNAPAPEVVEEAKAEETPVTEEVADPEEKHVSYSIQLQGETKSIPEPIAFENSKANPVQKLIDLLVSRGFTEEFIEETINPVLAEVREALIDAYNDGQTDTINILIGEIEKEAPELMEGMKEAFAGNINKLDAIEYYNNKFEA